MILHCTKKLAPKLLAIQNEPQQETSPMGSWHANLYTYDRRQCVLFTHDETRYSIFIPGLVISQFKHFEECFKSMFLASLSIMGVPDNQLTRVELAMGKMILDTNTDRSVLGSMTNLKQMIQARVNDVPNVMDLNILEVNHWLTEIPMKSKAHPDYGWPQEDMKALIDRL